MNVIVVNDNAHVNGGAAKVAIQEAVGLAARGHRVYFLCAVLPVDPQLMVANVRVVCSQQHDLISNPSRMQAFLQGWWNATAAKLTLEVLGEVGPDNTVIHLHTWSRALSPSVVQLAMESQIPAICTLHDFQLACPNGTFFDHSEQAICRRRPLSAACVLTNCDCRSYSQKLWRVGRQLIQIRLSGAPGKLTHVIAHSRLAAEVMRPYLPQACTVHHLPIYIESSRAAAATPESNETFVYMGRLVREKGVLLAAMASAAQGVPMLFLGSGPLSQEIREANPEATIAGWLDSQASVRHLRAARALIFPSLWHETLGLVVLEAAAHGIPAIVPENSAAAEVVRHGVTGLHFRPGDLVDLCARIREMKEPGLVRSLGRAAYERFWSSEYSSLQAHISSLEDIYLTALRGRSPELAPSAQMEVQRAGW